MDVADSLQAIIRVWSDIKAVQILVEYASNSMYWTSDFAWQISATRCLWLASTVSMRSGPH